jgi:hypothetical protein
VRERKRKKFRCRFFCGILKLKKEKENARVFCDLLSRDFRSRNRTCDSVRDFSVKGEKMVIFIAIVLLAAFLGYLAGMWDAHSFYMRKRGEI